MRYGQYETLPPYEVSDSLAPRIKGLDLAENLADMERDGYTVLRDVAPPEVTAAIREAIIRLSEETTGRAKGRSAAMLLGRDPIFATAVLNPTLMALVEFMCGQGALLSQLLGSVRPEGAKQLEIHADQNWLPAPFPAHNYLLTACWVCDDFTQENGATRVIPGTHMHRRHPSPDEATRAEGAIPVEAPTGSIAIWDGSVWHGNYPRETSGERVVLHITYSRLALRPIEDYGHLADEFLEANPPEMATLLGRTDFFSTTTPTSGGVDYREFTRTAATSKR